MTSSDLIAALPDWFAEGRAVGDLYERSDDACGIFDDEVLFSHELNDPSLGDATCGWGDLEWRECRIPVAAFNLPATLEEHLAKVPRQTLQGGRERVHAIAEWVRGCGGIGPALDESPLLLTLRNGRIKGEDGHHRLAVAHYLFGATHVTALCAVLHPSALKDIKRHLRPGL